MGGGEGEREGGGGGWQTECIRAFSSVKMTCCSDVKLETVGFLSSSITRPDEQAAERYVPFRELRGSNQDTGVQPPEASHRSFALLLLLCLCVEVVADAAAPAAGLASQAAGLLGQTVESLGRVAAESPRGQGSAALQDASVDSCKLC